MKKIYLLPLFLLICATVSWAQVECPLSDALLEQARQGWGKGKFNYNFNCRSDSADIQHYAIELDMTNLSKAYLRGHCTLTFVPLVDNFSALTLDFLLKVDSIVWQGQRLSHNKGKEQIQVIFPSSLPKGSSQDLRIYYQGAPPTGDWNGFYFSNDIAYNTGSSFDANPLSYGRAWHPCFESFRERATYSFLIKTKAPKVAQCNGYLVKRETKKDTILSYWRLDNTIPTYLAAIAVADFVIERDTFKGAERDIPIEICAVVSDTAKVHRSFVHLHYALSTMEKWFGPYAWNKVGYSMVPNLSGAMEHATNTTFSAALLNSPKEAEEYMIHELAHSWFGNQITCETGEDMWINEGLATYSESLFYEYTYGPKRMFQHLQKTAEDVLPYNTNDSFFPPLSGATHGFVYDSKYIYGRGALVGHSLRGYLGDVLFAKGMKAIMQKFKYKNINSVQFRDALSEATGKDLSHFFEDWVFSGGYVDVVLDSMQYKDGEAILYLRQELLGRSKPFEQMPVELMFMTDQGDTLTRNVILNEVHNIVKIKIPAYFDVVMIDPFYKLFLANLTSFAQGQKDLVHNGFPFMDKLQIKADSNFLIFAHYHYGNPKAALPFEGEISSYGYWDLDWRALKNISITARFEFAGASQTDLFSNKSLKGRPVLLYRANVGQPWQEWAGAKVRYTIADKNIGYIEAAELKAGLYAIGRKKK